MNRTEPQNQTTQETITALQTEIAHLRQRLEAAERREQSALEAYKDLELIHTPDDDDANFERLADAWATLEELGQGDYLTDKCYNQLAEILQEEVLDYTQWQTKPDILRRALPGIFREAIAMEDKRKAAFDDATELTRQAEAYDS